MIGGGRERHRDDPQFSVADLQWGLGGDEISPDTAQTTRKGLPVKTARTTLAAAGIAATALLLNGCASTAPDHIVFVGDPFVVQSGPLALAASDSLGATIHQNDIFLATRLAAENGTAIADVPVNDDTR